MARYIDADKLTEEYIKLQYSDQSMGIVSGRYISEIARVGRQPTADVVPSATIADALDELKQYIPPQKIGLFNFIYISDVIYELKKKYTGEQT